MLLADPEASHCSGVCENSFGDKKDKRILDQSRLACCLMGMNSGLPKACQIYRGSSGNVWLSELQK